MGLLPLERFCERACPPEPDQDIARPKYLNAAALDDPESALDLASREQARVVGFLPDLLDAARRDAGDSSERRMASAVRSLIDAIDAHDHELLSTQLSAEASLRAIVINQRQRTLSGLAEAIESLVGAMRECRAQSAAGETTMLVAGLVEAFDFNLQTLATATRTDDTEEWNMLLHMTEDRGPAMESLRHQLSEAGATMPPKLLRSALYATGIFERGMWLVRQYATSQ